MAIRDLKGSDSLKYWIFDWEKANRIRDETLKKEEKLEKEVQNLKDDGENRDKQKLKVDNVKYGLGLYGITVFIMIFMVSFLFVAEESMPSVDIP